MPDYSTIDRRVNRLDVKLDEENYGDDLVIAVDASGIKVTNRGEWIRHKWKVRRGYLKIHIAVDVKRKKILALEVTDEQVSDGRMLHAPNPSGRGDGIVQSCLDEDSMDGSVADGCDVFRPVVGEVSFVLLPTTSVAHMRKWCQSLMAKTARRMRTFCSFHGHNNASSC